MSRKPKTTLVVGALGVLCVKILHSAEGLYEVHYLNDVYVRNIHVNSRFQFYVAFLLRLGLALLQRAS